MTPTKMVQCDRCRGTGLLPYSHVRCGVCHGAGEYEAWDDDAAQQEGAEDSQEAP